MGPNNSEDARTAQHPKEVRATEQLSRNDESAADWAARIAELRRQCSADPRVGGERAIAAIEEARAQRLSDVESQLTRVLGVTQMMRNAPHEAAASMLRAIELARIAGRPDLEVHALSGLGAAHGHMNDSITAIQCFEQALLLQQDIPASDATDAMLGSLLMNMGGANLRLGCPDKATAMLRQAYDHFLQAGQADEATKALGNLASAEIAYAERLISQGLQSAAQDAARSARTISLRVISRGGSLATDGVTLATRLTLAAAETMLGNCAAASEELRTLESQLGESPVRALLQAHIVAIKARVLSATGGSAQAIADLRAELAKTPPTGQSAVDRLTLLRELTDAHEAAGDHVGALRTFREFHDLSEKIRDQAAEQRGQVFNARMQVERALHDAEVERLRAKELSLLNAELAQQVRIDPLTGLLNRRGLDAALALRTCDPRSRFAFMLVDIDHFKRVNDRFSHPVGDEVLHRVGALIREVVRDGDVAARYGGEEFALLLDRADNLRAKQIGERLRTAIAALAWDRVADGLAITVSIGIALRRNSESATALLARADERLYAAKRAGRNRVRLDRSTD